MPSLKRPLLAVLLAAGLAPAVAQALPPIADTPPPFHIYNVDRREREMRRLLGEMDGRAMSHRAARRALGELDQIHREEMRLRARHGGRLTVPVIRYVDTRLNALSRRLGLREPAY